MSNFAIIRAVTEKDDKGYFVRKTMFGVLNSFTPVEFTKTGSRFQQVMITDDSGEQQKVKIWLGDDKTIGDGCINRRLEFEISKNPFKNQMYYGGFWQDKAAVAPARPPTSSQVASKPPTPTDSTSTSEIDLRNMLLCSYIQAGEAYKVSDGAIYRRVLEDVKFIQQGEKYFTPKPEASSDGSPEDWDWEKPASED